MKGREIFWNIFLISFLIYWFWWGNSLGYSELYEDNIEQFTTGFQVIVTIAASAATAISGVFILRALQKFTKKNK